MDRKITAPVDNAAPGHQAFVDVTSQKTLYPFSMFFKPVRFWSRALETPVLQLRRTWFIHGLNFVIMSAESIINGHGTPFVHLVCLILASTLALAAIIMVCSVFFAFDSLSDTPHRLSQATRFVLCLSPFLLAMQCFFLSWAGKRQPHLLHFLLVSLIPLSFISCLLATQSRLAFASTIKRALAFGITAAIPWSLFLTILMSFLI